MMCKNGWMDRKEVDERMWMNDLEVSRIVGCIDTC